MISIHDLSENLQKYLNNLGLTEKQVNDMIYIYFNEKIGDEQDNSLTTIVEAINNVSEYVDNMEFTGYQKSRDESLITENKDIVDAINEIFNSQDKIKQELVGVLVNKGLELTTDISFEELLENIESSDLISSNGTAVVSNVLAGKTFINNTGELLTGTMVNQGSKTITPSKYNQTLPAGYYSGITINGDSNLIASNIRTGKNIFGVTGTAPTTVVCNVLIKAPWKCTGMGTSSGSGSYEALTMVGFDHPGFTTDEVSVYMSGITIKDNSGDYVMKFSGSVSFSTYSSGTITHEGTSYDGATLKFSVSDVDVKKGYSSTVTILCESSRFYNDTGSYYYISSCDTFTFTFTR